MWEEKKLYTQDELAWEDNGFLSDFFVVQETQEVEETVDYWIEVEKISDIFDIKKPSSNDLTVDKPAQKSTNFKKEVWDNKSTNKAFVKWKNKSNKPYTKQSNNKWISIEQWTWRENKIEEENNTKVVSPNLIQTQEKKSSIWQSKPFVRTNTTNNRPRPANSADWKKYQWNKQSTSNYKKTTSSQWPSTYQQNTQSNRTPTTKSTTNFQNRSTTWNLQGQNRSASWYQGRSKSFWWPKSNTNRSFQNKDAWRNIRQSPSSTSNVRKVDKVPSEAKTSSTLKKKTLITIPDKISIKEFSEKMWVNLWEVMKKLLKNKIILPATASIDFDTASLIWVEFDVEVKRAEADVSIDDIISGNLQVIMDQDKLSENLVERPPIVTIMWHVDHWKTTLLDYLRQTSIVNSESWWITQSIWWSQIVHSGKKITFIDTPWHELFTSLRARWAKITDIVVIVVAADDWVKQQTIEAINHAKDAWVPIVVAITKIDKPSSNIDMIKSQLAEHELIPEEWWGDIPIVMISAVTWEWVETLMENILLQSEILELKYNPDRLWVWVVLEAHKDTKKWVTTSLILMSWKMSLWDVVVIHNTYWKVRKMVDWKWADIKTAYAWDPVLILWIQSLPEPWRVTEVMKTEKEASAKVSLIKSKDVKWDTIWWLQSMLEKISQWENVMLKLILKWDSFGSLEALKYSISKVELPENIEIKIVHADVWSITDSDLILAQASDSFVIWFGVPYTNAMKKSADQKTVVMKNFSIIYEILDYVDRLAKWLVKIEEKEVVIGKLKVLGIFFKKWKEIILWWRVLEWKITNWALFRTFRWEELIWWWRIMSLKRDQDNVNEVNEWYECWMKLKADKKIEDEDILEFFVME